MSLQLISFFLSASIIMRIRVHGCRWYHPYHFNRLKFSLVRECTKVTILFHYVEYFITTEPTFLSSPHLCLLYVITLCGLREDVVRFPWIFSDAIIAWRERNWCIERIDAYLFYEETGREKKWRATTRKNKSIGCTLISTAMLVWSIFVIFPRWGWFVHFDANVCS